MLEVMERNECAVDNSIQTCLVRAKVVWLQIYMKNDS